MEDNNTKHNVLIVDDRPDGLLAMEMILSDMELTLIKAGSGKEALEIVNEYDIALIILDVRMPDIDGIETASLIKEREISKYTPIIFITGYEGEGNSVLKGYKAGAADFLVKPIDPDILKSKVCFFLELHTNRRRLEELSFRLQQSEERYKRVIENAGDAMFIADLETGTIIDTNNKAEELIGMTREEIIGLNMKQLHPPDESGLYSGIFNMHVKDQHSTIEDLYVRHKDGRNIPVDIRTSVIKMNDKKIMAGFLRDITARKKMEEELIRKTESLDEAQRIANIGNWDWDIEKNELRWSDQIYRIFGLEPQEFGATYESFLSMIPLGDRERVIDSVNLSLKKNAPFNLEHRVKGPNGLERFVRERGRVYFNDHGKPSRMVGTVQDITDMKKSESELRKLTMVIEASANIIFITDQTGKIEYINNRFQEITGYGKEEIIGKTPQMLSSGETTSHEYSKLWETILSKRTWRGVFRNKKKDGAFYWANTIISPVLDSRGEIVHFLAIQEDITEKKKSQEKLWYLSNYDPVTGLLNRMRFIELFNEWLSYNEPFNSTGALLHVDIDGFKYINDTYGHISGDEFLRRIGGSIHDNVRALEKHRTSNDEHLLGRIGENEFMLFLPFYEKDEALTAADEIRKGIEEFHYTEKDIRATASIGIALYPAHGATSTELLRATDAAVLRAKKFGHNRSHLYRFEDRDLKNIHSKVKEKELILKALQEGRFEPWFQPILHISENKIRHYEALARLRGEEGEIITPGGFIGAAEMFGLIGAIDRIITTKTMELQAEMQRQGKSISFSMNLSGKVMGDEELLDFLQSKITETGANPRHLIFEITETAAIYDLDRAVRFIEALKEMGCLFSLDDFGVGFTSFVYLREMKVDYIKIDGSFVSKVNVSPQDQLVVRAITGVARGMGIATVAEFVENVDILKFLKLIEVDYAQGYLIGKPLPDLLE